MSSSSSGRRPASSGRRRERGREEADQGELFQNVPNLTLHSSRRGCKYRIKERRQAYMTCKYEKDEETMSVLLLLARVDGLNAREKSGHQPQLGHLSSHTSQAPQRGSIDKHVQSTRYLLRTGHASHAFRRRRPARTLAPHCLTTSRHTATCHVASVHPPKPEHLLDYSSVCSYSCPPL